MSSSAPHTPIPIPVYKYSTEFPCEVIFSNLAQLSFYNYTHAQKESDYVIVTSKSYSADLAGRQVSEWVGGWCGLCYYGSYYGKKIFFFTT